MELWSSTHIKTLPLAILCMIIIAVVLRTFLINKPLKIRAIPFMVVAFSLFVLEIFKQVLSAIDGEYDLYHIPLHYCSILIFLPTLASIGILVFKNKDGKINAISTATVTATMALTIIYPCLIYSADNIKNYFNGFFDFHTVTFHNLAIFAGILLVALNIHTPNFKKNKWAILLFIVGFCALSSSMAQILQTNFANFYSCNIAPLESVRQTVADACGYWPAQILYIIINSALNLAFTLGSYGLYTLLYKIFNKKHLVKGD